MPSNIAHYLSPNCRLPTDVDFEVYASSSSSPAHVRAHKCFLADASTVFEEMFYKDGKSIVGTEEVTVRIDNMDESIFRLFLKHLYGGKVEVGELDISSLLNMSELVEKYKIEHLGQELVENVKSQQVNQENIFEVVEKLKNLTNSSEMKDIGETMVSDYLKVKYESVSRLVNFLSGTSVEGENILFMMKIMAKAGMVDKEEADGVSAAEAEDKRKILCKFLMFVSFPEDHVNELVEKFMLEDSASC